MIASCSRRRFRKDETLFHQGESGETLFIVERGKVAMRMRTADGDEVTAMISTPQRTTVFKELSRVVDRISRHRLATKYYAGKATELDENSQPVVHVDDGHEHISEMTLAELRACLSRSAFAVESVEPMTVMSGSTWFDDHPMLLSGVLVLEAAHRRLQRPTWAHGVCVLARKPQGRQYPTAARSGGAHVGGQADRRRSFVETSLAK